MQDKKVIVTCNKYNLLRVDVLDVDKIIVRTSYEVTDLHEEVIGRFGSLRDAHNYIKLLEPINRQGLII